MNLKKVLTNLTLVVLIFIGFSTISLAQSAPKATAIPPTNLKVIDCRAIMRFIERNVDETIDVVFNSRENLNSVNNFNSLYSELGEVTLNDVLACGIKNGDISLWMAPYYIRYFLEFLIGIAGIAAVLGIIIGGFRYLFAGVSEDKEAGKKALMYSIGGFVLIMLAYVIVNIVIALASG
ncbi:hypothetical protein GF354_02140 [Candidatus Peregrinibacteria bacterium]|nr:hypothetical protein [Candidatus Peregrinibacteria bacterium]